MVSLTKAQCPLCKREWLLRVPYPKQCPFRDCGKRWPLGKPSEERESPQVCTRCGSTDFAIFAGPSGRRLRCSRCAQAVVP